MVDLSNLAPAEMAELLGKPEGEVGSAIGEMLNRTNLGVTEAVYKRLHLQHAQHVLGCVPIAATTKHLIQAVPEGLDHGGIVLADRCAMGGY